MKNLYLIVCGVLLMGSTTVSAQKIEGKIFDKELNVPIAEGDITFYSKKGDRIATVYTNTSGQYEFEPKDLALVHKIVGTAKDYTKAEVLVNQIEDGVVANFGLLKDKGALKNNTSYTAKETEARARFKEERVDNSRSLTVSRTDYSFVTLPTFYYDFNSSYMTPENKSVVDQIVNLMRQDNSIRIRIHVYNDTRGNSKYNEWLTERRATRVYDYMIAKGISRDRLGTRVETINSDIPRKSDSYARSSSQENRRCDFEII
ncbi:OmpA family protein [Myroides sp. BIT-d1]|uniref:OmpA family protein n=1 Tax=Myroides albus TaxID=2562892 RepID=A0A6I3LFE0_9FLAO|nr:OmpA family protein [Myroides albus]MTG98179.1 OmpA family protein [Myroides albus]